MSGAYFLCLPSENLQSNSARISAISESFLFPFDMICLNKRSDITNPRYIEPISVSVECSKWQGSTVIQFEFPGELRIEFSPKRPTTFKFWQMKI